MSCSLSFLILAVPGLPFAAGLASPALAPRTAGRLATYAAVLATVLTVAAIGMLLFCGPQTVRWAPFGENSALACALRLDATSAVMGLVVSSLGALVLAFSKRYLEGDPSQASFFSWMSLTLASVLGLVFSGHLLVLLGSWVSTSLCLHRLLLHYPERAGAVFAARKKFVFSRLGDICLLAASLVLYAHHGTFDIEALFADVAHGDTGGVALCTLLLAACAMLKSAQFPFHSWLPDTMETPTPVSAFMHAGIINAGGYLLVRLAPLLAASPFTSELLALSGAVTAAFGAVVMLAQPSVKRALAFSTIAQMGFMVLQCGLGAYGLALLHIASHSFYKAYAFLTSGSTVGAVPRAAIPLRAPALTLGVLAGGLIVTVVTTAREALAPEASAVSSVLSLVLWLALGYGLARAWSAGGRVRTIFRGFAAAAAMGLISLCLHAGTLALFRDMPAAAPLPPHLLLAVGAVFSGLFLFQALLWRANLHPAGRRLYVHALNGFYVGIVLNRLLGRLWPLQAN